MAGRDDARMISAGNLEGRGVAYVKRLAELITVALQQLQTEAVIRSKPEIVDLVVAGLAGQAVRVMFVGRISGPPARAHRKQFRHQQPADAPRGLLAENVLDLAMCLGVVGAVLHRIDVLGPYHERLEGLVEARARLHGAGGSVHYLKTEADGGWYHGFNKDFIFSFTGSTGYVDGWNGDTIRISDRFYKGGDTFRGFQIAGIGPRDTQFGDALGGKFYAIGTMELTIPTKLPEQYGIKAALFTDFGTLGVLDRANKVDPNTNLPLTTVQDDLGLRASAGISIFWKSPMGPLRFDFSQIIKKDKYDKTELFRFSTATRF